MKEVLFLADANSRVNQQIALGLAERLQAEGRWIAHIPAMMNLGGRVGRMSLPQGFSNGPKRDED